MKSGLYKKWWMNADESCFWRRGRFNGERIPDFRSVDGLYHHQQYAYPPEEMLSHVDV